MRPQIITIASLTNDANGVFEDQQLAGAGDFTLNGVLVNGGVATIAQAQKISFESAGNLSARTFTITGTDADGRSITDTVSGPNANTVATTKYFKTVTQISSNGAVGTNVECGPLIADGCVSRIIPMDWRASTFNVSLAAVLSSGATLNYDVQHTLDDVQASADLTWFDHENMANKTANDDGNYAFPVRGIRLLLNSYTSGSIVLTILQAGDP